MKRTSHAKPLSVTVAILFTGSLLAVTPAAGQSEFDQYVPAVPDAEDESALPAPNNGSQGGGGSGGGGSTGGGVGGGSPIPGDVAGDLEAQGAPTGESAAGVAEAAAPQGGKDNRGGDTRSDSRNRGDSDDAYETSSAGTVASTLGGDSDEGMGVMLPLLLALTVAVGAGYLLLRWRRRARERAQTGTG